jgi:hypothetical protein
MGENAKVQVEEELKKYQEVQQGGEGGGWWGRQEA